MRYPLSFYWATGVGEGHAASTRLCFIFIRPDKKGDEGLYQHELTHVKQWAFVTLVVGLFIALFAPMWSGLAISVFGMLYTAFPDIRLLAEVQAYKKQLKYYPDDRTAKFAGYIFKHYGLDTPYLEIERLLKAKQ